MEKNKTGKYFKYAIGEIILVVIGIIIALQLNNWNTQRNLSERQTSFIIQIISDLKKSEIEIEEIKDFYFTRAEASSRITKSFWNNKMRNDSIFPNFTIPLSHRSYSPILGTINSLINSGNVDLIKSVTIRNAFISYIEKTEAELNDIIRYEESYYRDGINLLFQEIDFYSLEVIFQKKEFQKMISQVSKERLTTFPVPKKFDKVPFPITLEELFENRNIYNAYIYLIISHRNTFYGYQRIQDSIKELLILLEEDGYYIQ